MLVLVRVVVGGWATAATVGPGIHDLAGSGEIAAITSVLADDPSLIESRDENGRTPLATACRARQWKTVRFLVHLGANVDTRDDYLSTPLHFLAYRDAADEILLLVDAGAGKNAKNHESHTPLHMAVLADATRAAAALIESGAATEVRDDYDRTPLILCAREACGVETLDVLIGGGAAVTTRDRFGADALELAAWRGKITTVDRLLDAGATLPEDRTRIEKLLLYAAEHGITRLFDKLLHSEHAATSELYGGGRLVRAASAGGSLDILNILAAAGHDLEAADDFGWTPLHHAAKSQRTECVRWLIAKEVELERRTLAGETDYNHASETVSDPTTALLEAAGADTSGVRFPPLEGPYLGQPLPSDDPVRFATGIVSSVWSLHSSVAVSPTGDTVFWSPMIQKPGEVYSRSHIMMMRQKNGRWSAPVSAPFTRGRPSDVAFFSPNGRRVYFLSRETLPNEPESGRERIWYSDRAGDGWAPPRLVDAAVNDAPQHWQFSVDSRHTIYFSADLPGGHGAGDLYAAPMCDGKWSAPVELGPPVNSPADEATPFISPNGDYLIFQRDGDLFISYRNEESWTPPRSLGGSINTTFKELCPIVSPDGRYLFFLSDRLGQSHVFWVATAFIERLRPDTS